MSTFTDVYEAHCTPEQCIARAADLERKAHGMLAEASTLRGIADMKHRAAENQTGHTGGGS